MSGGIANASSSACVRIVARPYVKYYGGDVAFCKDPANPGALVGNVYTWAKNSGGYTGSSTQYALFAKGTVDGPGTYSNHGFYSRSVSSTGAPKYLTFANASAAATFGGDFSSDAPTECKNYYTDEATNVLSMPAANKTVLPISGTAYSGRNITTAGENHIVYVTGNVFIDGNITNSVSAGTRAAIPVFKLIASGNIYIKNTVTQLYGFYYAGGKVYTCVGSNPGAAMTTAFPGYSSCNNQLKVTGAMQANGGIKYWRTYGTLRSATTTENTNNGSSTSAAEVFIMTPETYLGQWTAGGAENAFNGQAQGVKSLPPVF
jgi:hypothetical protein